MRWRDAADRFGTVSIINHWLLAAVVIALLASGLVIGELVEEGAIRRTLLGPHKAVGPLVLALVAWLPLRWALQRDRPAPARSAAPRRRRTGRSPACGRHGLAKVGMYRARRRVAAA